MPAKRVLIVDDEPNIGRSLRLILEREGYAVLTFTSVRGIAVERHAARRRRTCSTCACRTAAASTCCKSIRAGENPSAGDHDLGPRDHLRRGRSDARRRLRFSRETARPRQGPARHQECARTGQPARGERAPARDGRRPAAHDRVEPGFPAHPRAGHHGGALRRARAADRRVGHRQGAARRAHPSPRAPSRPARSSRSTAPPSRPSCSRANCSATRRAPSRARPPRGAASSSWPTAARSFSTRSATCTAVRRPSCCACCRKASSTASAASSRFASNVRVISATNRDLAEMVAQDKFREDLYYRLSVVPIRVPSAARAPQDIRPMAEYFLDEFCRRNNFRPKSFDERVFPAVEHYAWPGNVRELRNVVERMAILTAGRPADGRFRAARNPSLQGSRRKSTVQEARDSAERDHILRALEDTDWNVSGRRPLARRRAHHPAQTHPRLGPESVASAFLHLSENLQAFDHGPAVVIAGFPDIGFRSPRL